MLQEFFNRILNILYPKEDEAIILVILIAHHIPTLMSCTGTLCISLRLSAATVCYFEYLCDCLSNLVLKMSKEIIDFTITHYFTKPVTNPYSHKEDFDGYASQCTSFLWKNVMFATSSSLKKHLLFEFGLSINVVLIF